MKLPLRHYRCVDTKQPLKRLGYPDLEKNADVSLVAQMYVDEIDRIKESYGTERYDVVLVDGRFRVSCALKLLTGGYIDTESVVMIHDYRYRHKYHVVERFFNRIRKDDTVTLGVFVMKENIDETELAAAVEKYREQMD